MPATICIRASDLIPQPDGRFTVRLPNDSVLSVQKDGSIGTRPTGTATQWELCRKVGNKLIFEDSGYPTGAYALLLVE
jgi:hypothetical protein